MTTLTGERVTSGSGERMVATSHPLAVQAAVTIMDQGGTAADAAVAAAAVLNVVDPRSTGIGGDAFALYWPAGDPGPMGLSAAGPAPAAMTLGALTDAGHSTMPQEGPWSITVPGSVAGWGALLSRFGRKDLSEVLAPAIALAREGFMVAPKIAEEWNTASSKLMRYEESARVYLPSGRSPGEGERFVNPDLASSLEALAQEGTKVFYEGWLAGSIGAAVAAAGGPLRAEDLSSWSGPEWVKPIRGRFREVDVYEIPPPGQGIVTLMALAIFETLDVADPVDREHAAIEAMKLAFADAAAYVADPQASAVPTEALLSPTYLRERSGQIDMESASVGTSGDPGDTVYLAVVDDHGDACSFIQSLYEGFGSGIAVPGTGIVMQNRGANFVLDPDHPNCVAPGKRPYHTIIPALLGRNDVFYGCLGVVGGFMQPQAQMQILRRLMDDGASPKEAVDGPRWRYIEGKTVGFEPGFDPAVVSGLARRGHEVKDLGRFEAGGAQLIIKSAEGLTGASDPRKDGVAHG